MKTAARNIILFFILFYSSAAYTQTAWIDSVKKLLPTQKEDTSKVQTLIRLSNDYAFSYPDTKRFLYGRVWQPVYITDSSMTINTFAIVTTGQTAL
jgi:hypothetical protein